MVNTGLGYTKIRTGVIYGNTQERLYIQNGLIHGLDYTLTGTGVRHVHGTTRAEAMGGKTGDEDTYCKIV